MSISADNNWVLLRDVAESRTYGAYSTLRNYIDQGRVRAKKVAGRIKVYEPDLKALEEARSPKSEKAYARAESAIRRVVDSAPALTDEQRERLAVLVRGGSANASKELASAGGGTRA